MSNQKAIDKIEESEGYISNHDRRSIVYKVLMDVKRILKEPEGNSKFRTCDSCGTLVKVDKICMVCLKW